MIFDLVHSERGQATVEYLVVGVVIILFAAGLAVFWKYLSSSGFHDVVAQNASHDAGTVGGVADALLY